MEIRRFGKFLSEGSERNKINGYRKREKEIEYNSRGYTVHLGVFACVFCLRVTR